MNTTLRTTADNLGYIDQIMRRVQDCEWSSFKMNEIVTLGRCLQDCSSLEPQFNVILRKMANESVFVEPSRRLKHLNRSKQEEQADIEHKRSSVELRVKIDKMTDEICFYQSKLNELINEERQMRAEIGQLEKSSAASELACKFLTDELDLLLQRVYGSFECSLSILKEQLPEYMRTVSRSKLVQQPGALPLLYRRGLIELMKQQGKHNKTTPSFAGGGCDDLTTIVHNFMRLANTHLSDYLRALMELYRDLAMINKLYLNEIPAELGEIQVLNQHISYLETPSDGPIRKVIYLYDDTMESSRGDKDGLELGGSFSLVSTGKIISKLDVVAGKESDVTDDPELAEMLVTISKLCKPVCSNSS